MKKKTGYKDNPWTEDPPGRIKIIPDLLPSPEVLAAAEKKQKITLELSENALHFFKKQAHIHNLPYQLMIRRVLDSYASQYSKR